ncbi:DUF4873 domain-containing protein [Mycobacteroides chelonae]|uniref:DUF4873 domain-containing protein n=1 Tax=Mycobacteroides chelonae TaxID=1774 RepID=A0AB73TVB7_MYCCH|nr:DUF4873 domain-containing protein [Mycobacteroides chelonae]MBF9352746.1 DUF4873 domain-containing protein [Mycobacteroides chelonae]MEC4841293.1 DUF4873 domain-containing protein [Mycobacteroides chelonae]MEC4845667.1 DUF4873 domain-containing protein [Mycobacteroides chelonae]MEC4854758.1 DUF4873 domain-containing protein [Mycobacteroides chelonae]OHU44764.1 DUF4873 domain-containing protein [Mycobacteroides chelonae]
MRPEDFANRETELDYSGTAILVIDGQEHESLVELRGFFQPIDGTYRWHGRVRSASPELAQHAGSRADGFIRTPHGQASVTIDEVDLWGRYRLRGTGRPPFPVAATLADVE